MDLLMPGTDGVTATAAITQRYPERRRGGDDQLQRGRPVRGALEAGAAGYLLKDAEADEVAARSGPPAAARCRWTRRSPGSWPGR